ncbi:MAG: hypothetical protein A2V88_08795 [Elusimicrobia bacterium RBG_16_66_12]|nr:MAG: hypothetical protein A2V88_08795 [Elusimicrobia bacterium RBG_16_66_12]
MSIWLFYRGNTARVIVGPQSGAAYECQPRSFLQVDERDAPQLIRMPKAKCGCGRLFQRRSPRGA